VSDRGERRVRFQIEKPLPALPLGSQEEEAWWREKGADMGFEEEWEERERRRKEML